MDRVLSETRIRPKAYKKFFEKGTAASQQF